MPANHGIKLDCRFFFPPSSPLPPPLLSVVLLLVSVSPLADRVLLSKSNAARQTRPATFRQNAARNAAETSILLFITPAGTKQTDNRLLNREYFPQIGKWI